MTRIYFFLFGIFVELFKDKYWDLLLKVAKLDRNKSVDNKINFKKYNNNKIKNNLRVFKKSFKTHFLKILIQTIFFLF